MNVEIITRPNAESFSDELVRLMVAGYKMTHFSTAYAGVVVAYTGVFERE